jgi:hypothetical protein
VILEFGLIAALKIRWNPKGQSNKAAAMQETRTIEMSFGRALS